MNVQVLIQEVIANNSAETADTINGMSNVNPKKEPKITVNGLSSKEELQAYSNQIEITKKYNVTMEKDASGYINSIKIAE